MRSYEGRREREGLTLEEVLADLAPILLGDDLV
jgi:hypothetical protein